MSETTRYPIAVEQRRIVFTDLIEVEITALAANTLLRFDIQSTIIDISRVVPLGVMQDVYVDYHSLGYILNSVDYDYSITTDNNSYRFNSFIGRYENAVQNNLVTVSFHLTNTEEASHDYFLDYRVILLRQDI